MNRLSLRKNRLKFKTARKLITILENFIKYALVESMAKNRNFFFSIAVLLTTLVCNFLNDYKILFFILRLQKLNVLGCMI